MDRCVSYNGHRDLHLSKVENVLNNQDSSQERLFPEVTQAQLRRSWVQMGGVKPREVNGDGSTGFIL